MVKENVFIQLLQFFGLVYDGFSSVFDFFQLTVRQIVYQLNTGNEYIESVLNIVMKVLDNISVAGVPLSDVTLISLLFGSSLSYFIVVAFVQWLFKLRV